MRKIKDFILLLITSIAWTTMFASFMALAEGSAGALITLIVSLAWMYLFCKANKEILE